MTDKGRGRAREGQDRGDEDEESGNPEEQEVMKWKAAQQAHSAHLILPPAGRSN